MLMRDALSNGFTSLPKFPLYLQSREEGSFSTSTQGKVLGLKCSISKSLGVQSAMNLSDKQSPHWASLAFPHQPKLCKQHFLNESTATPPVMQNRCHLTHGEVLQLKESILYKL
jgi:hypothetical protein